MALQNTIVNAMSLDRSIYHPKNSDGNFFRYAETITAAKTFKIDVDLNGVSNIQFFIAETGNSNNIPGFNLTAKFYEPMNIEVTSAEQTIAIPVTTKNTNQYVDITGSDFIKKCDKAILSGTLLYTAAYTITFFAKGIFETAIDEPLAVEDAQMYSAMGTLQATQLSILTAAQTLTAATYPDNDTFSTSADRTVMMAGLVNPTDTISAGNVAAIALNEEREQIISATDKITDAVRITDIFPKWEHQGWSTLASVTNATDGTYTYYEDMEGYNRYALGILAGASTGSFTLDIYGSIQNDGTAPDSIVEWETISTAFLGGTKTYSTTAIDTFGNGESIADNYKYLKIVIVATASATADWNLRSHKWSE